MKNITFILFFTLCVSTQVVAQSVRLRTDIDLAVSGKTSLGSNNISLNVVEPSGDATAEDSPAIIYVPIENSITQTHLYYFNASSGFPTSLFNTSVVTDVINFPLRIITPNTDFYLYAAIKDPNDSSKFKVIKRYSADPLDQGQTLDISFPLSPAKICLMLPSECTYLVENSTAPTEKNFIVYFFMSTASSYADNQELEITKEPLNNGIYFKIFMSNRVYEDSTLRITIKSNRPGDGRVILNYSSTGTLSSDYAKSVKVYKHSSDPVITNMAIGETGYSGSLLPQDFEYVQNSEITVNGLTNGVETTLSVVFLDKFNFVTTLSKEVKTTPLEIQELLKKNACFLLTAGFGEDHYVIEYFRHFRDNILASSYLGKSFIHVYYELAPKYALKIYQYEVIRSFIRGIAYSLYFIFNFYYLFVAAFIGSLALHVLNKRSKKSKA